MRRAGSNLKRDSCLSAESLGTVFLPALRHDSCEVEFALCVSKGLPLLRDIDQSMWCNGVPDYNSLVCNCYSSNLGEVHAA